jgi:DNA-binding response OmpR family regulator
MEALASELVKQRYAVDIATDGEACKDYLDLFEYDLLVLDVSLPNVDGIEVCRQLRSKGYCLPILMLSAKDDRSTKVEALNAGADDYVVKPFDFEELQARMHALLRRERHALPPVLQWGELRLNPSTFEANYAGQLLHLTPKEFALLEQFLRNSELVFSIDAIISSLWSFEEPPSEYAVRTHIKGLRQKLVQAGAPKDFIETVYGIGYRLKPLAAKVEPVTVEPPTHTLSSRESSALPNSPSTAATQPDTALTNVALAKAWEKFKDVAAERLAVMETTAAALRAGTCDRELHQRAKADAHKLVGSLGSFGFGEGSKLARQLERLLAAELPLDGRAVQQVSHLVVSLRQELDLGMPHLPPSPPPVTDGLLLLIVDGNREFAQQLELEASGLGLRTEIVETGGKARQFLTHTIPNAVVLQLSFSNTLEAESENLALLAEISHRTPPLPVVAIASGGDLTSRLEIVRQGGKLVLHQPVTPAQVMVAVTNLLQPPGLGAKVMVVDDDPQFLAALRVNLAPWGFHLTTLDDPTQFWASLERVSPDLLVLDVAMPHIDGLDLCQVLRSDLRWQHLPVLFLTAHEDPETQHRAFATGADDFVRKPVAASELANRILNRLARTRSSFGSVAIPH